MNIVHGQSPKPAVPGTKTAQGSGPHRFQEAVGERLSRDREYIQTGVNLPQALGYCFQEVGFAQAHTTMNDQRVERLAGCMDHLSRCGVCQLIAWPRHEVVKESRRTDGSRYSRKSRRRSLAVHR